MLYIKIKKITITLKNPNIYVSKTFTICRLHMAGITKKQAEIPDFIVVPQKTGKK